MQEFGSDFHYIDNYNSNRAHLTDVYKDVVFFADGRQCLIALMKQYGWKRIWMPEYFCYEVIGSFAEASDAEIAYYHDSPTSDDSAVVTSLPYEEGDVLLRVNYFGLRDFRSEKNIPVPVIEDHTHDLMGRWSLYSDADWCIASLRKILPIPEGGMMWSPKGHQYLSKVKSTPENNDVAQKRWTAMEMKSGYLAGEQVEKDSFRKLYIETEEWFDHAGLSGIDERTRTYLNHLDINAWVSAKRQNWKALKELVKTNVPVLEPEEESCNVFSFLILAKDREQRDQWRKELIVRKVYPAILWNVPNNVNAKAKDLSNRILSIHCDGRYSVGDMEQLSILLNEILK